MLILKVKKLRQRDKTTPGVPPEAYSQTDQVSCLPGQASPAPAPRVLRAFSTAACLPPVPRGTWQSALPLLFDCLETEPTAAGRAQLLLVS